MNTSLRITVSNTSDAGGTALTPFFAGFHDGSFDLYDRGVAASAGLEALAEDGNNSVAAAELVTADADAQSINVVGDRGPIAAGETASATIDVDGLSNGFINVGSMILPSNDAFVANGVALRLFDSSGRFQGAQTLVFEGSDVLDAGTEVNTEMDAAFINQTAPNTGVTEGGVVTAHPGFNGSLGNPGGDQIILGGTNAFGEIVDPTAADFTLPDAQIATVHINTAVERDGTAGRDIITGGSDDDLVDAGNGNDFIFTRGGWDVVDAGGGRDNVNTGSGNDVIDGGAGKDVLSGGTGDDSISGGTGADLVVGGRGRDTLSGDEGHDKLFGGNGGDTIDGGSGRDLIFGGNGHDEITGGVGDDRSFGGRGNDTFVFSSGDGDDVIGDFDRRGNDTLELDLTGFDSAQDVIDAAVQTRAGTLLDFGNEGSIFLQGVGIASLTEDDFIFG